ncbi:leukemia-associated protein 7 [Trichosurus vulpecula]|uniref:leukemia-associated protein 7 n=1 Tax=Trichosurus vulpecula TaxID=9337 RepID=UPI00186B189E|nr:leukemia-associated protein 7 [Trichosurus vulpecula]
MAGPTHLQVAVSHQIMALQTLRVLQQQRDRNLGQPSAALGQAGPRGDGAKAQGSAVVASGGDGGAASGPRATGQCEMALMAVRTVLARVVEATSQLIQVEQTLLTPLHEELNLPVYLKDSVDFRNICNHMARQQGQAFDQDLNEAYQCLKTIIKKLIHSVLQLPADVRRLACIALRKVLQNLLNL